MAILCTCWQSRASKSVAGANMQCEELQRLKHEYERSLRVWSPLCLSTASDVLNHGSKWPSLQA
jgi:hypothetical protein